MNLNAYEISEDAKNFCTLKFEALIEASKFHVAPQTHNVGIAISAD